MCFFQGLLSKNGLQLIVFWCSLNNGCSPAPFERDPARNKMQHTEETKKSKEELVEELMAKLKENLMKGRNQVAANEDFEGGHQVIRGESPGNEERAEMKDRLVCEELFASGELVVKNMLLEKMDKEECSVKEETAETINEHNLEDIFIKEEVTKGSVLVEEGYGVKYDAGAGGKGLHMEKEMISEELKFKKAEEVNTYLCKKFGRREHLNRHIGIVHFNERLSHCEETDCDKKFARRSHLNRHVRTLHLKDTPYHCEESGCDKKFGRRWDLKQHIRDVHLKEKPNQCEEPGCDKKFARRSHLNQHIRIVHSKDKPHTCEKPDCGKKFGLKINLTHHIRAVHNKEKPFACQKPGCNKTYSSPHGLQYHLQASHIAP